jgi:flagellar motor switch protein FliG
MSTIDLQAEIVQMIKDESDTSVLEAIRTLLYRLQQRQVDDDFTAEDIAELDERRARRLSGESKGHTAEESIRMLRAAQANDEAA